MKLCKDCMFYEGKLDVEYGYIDTCHRLQTKITCPVTGRVHWKGKELDAWSQRHMPKPTWWRKPETIDYCMMSAQYFKPKE